ncbi:murein/chitin-binding LysM domain protein [Geotalea daltonii FRC-32]|uniref:Murein/chitin-binding LysM domain protein n=1 Tax=Geotalea daltonii (strain DSM 22248 / JCM 15807 / FRC-32) TaxID=316067 RepID=B9M4E2_GEODF|nr:LysM domain-containing protein [Geotalea daltonii]ACM19668.1 murein/chitin-binding LysM domain protein [Geotalea daltonii FRC-32]
MIRLRLGLIATAIFVVLSARAGVAGDSPFEIDIRELDRNTTPAPSKKRVSAAKPPHPAAAKAVDQRKGDRRERKPLSRSGHMSYTVKNGDHIFKILMKHFGMTNAAAEKLIPEVVTLNKIADIRKLNIGQTILIPTGLSHTAVAHKKKRETEAASSAAEPAIQQRFSTVQSIETPVSAAIAVRSVTSKDPSEVADSILNILAVKPGKDHFVETSAATQQALRLSAKVDRFFESNGKHFMVSFSAAEPFAYTVYRLLELEGIKLIRINRDADLKQVATSILSAMDISFRYGEHAVLLNDRNRTSTSLNGFLFTRETTPPRLILLTEVPVAALTAELLERKETDQR